MRTYVVAMACLGLLGLSESASAQACKPVSERKGDVGCWIIAHESLGKLDQPIFWHLDAFPTIEAANTAKGLHGTVVESLGKVWLLTIENKGWRPSSGERVAEIGPLPINAGEEYSAQFMEAIFNPGMTAAEHTHSGPEAWYTLAGETCLETPEGKQVGSVGNHIIVPGGPPMHLTATGTVQRKSIVLILHDSSKPASSPEHNWKPKGLCKS
jgi:quercetin dioxygenase-like cupin family protein